MVTPRNSQMPKKPKTNPKEKRERTDLDEEDRKERNMYYTIQDSEFFEHAYERFRVPQSMHTMRGRYIYRENCEEDLLRLLGHLLPNDVDRTDESWIEIRQQTEEPMIRKRERARYFHALFK